jgi:hypothetical protein
LCSVLSSLLEVESLLISALFLGPMQVPRIGGRQGLVLSGTGSAVDSPLGVLCLNQHVGAVNHMSRAQGTSPGKMCSSFQNAVRASTMGINNRCQEQLLLTYGCSSFKYIFCGETKGFQHALLWNVQGCFLPFPVAAVLVFIS